MASRYSDNAVKANSSGLRPHAWFYYSTIYGAEDGNKTTAYMTRLAVKRLRLHIFWRGDADPDCHDHPWGFWTFPFRDYVEEVLDVTTGIKTRNVVEAWKWHYRPATYAHRVLWSRRLRGGWLHSSFTSDVYKEKMTRPIVTIVWADHPSREWGFWKGKGIAICWQLWKDYIFKGGKSAPCDDAQRT